MINYLKVSIAIFAICVQEVQAQTYTPVSLPSLFSNNMVLQQEDSVSLWGWGNAGSTVKIVGSWNPKDTISATIDDYGRWMGKIKTTRFGGPYNLHIFSAERPEDNHVLKNIMLGEVWLCSGQSNMEWTPENGITRQQEEIENANFPNIRFFSLDKRASQTPQNDCRAIWETCTSSVMQKRSALAYFFGKHLHQQLEVPIGLIVAAWGGTPAEVWIPEEAVPDSPQQQKITASRKTPWWPVEPGVLYNSMIHPLMPYQIAGTIWYQGESNRDAPQMYATFMQQLIQAWRKGFNKDFPFYQVQIAPFNYGSNDNGPALLREAQEEVTRIVPRTEVIITNDVGETHNIHPARKQEVGIRLADIALAENYKVLDKEVRSPFLMEANTKKNKVVLVFKYAEEGLVCKEKVVRGLQIAGEDGVFKEAKVRIKGNTLTAYVPEIKQPCAVRYCFDDASVGNVSNKQGLPLAPFHRNLTAE